MIFAYYVQSDDRSCAMGQLVIRNGLSPTNRAQCAIDHRNVSIDHVQCDDCACAMNFLIQSTPLNRVTSVRGHFAPIKRRILLTENILY